MAHMCSDILNFINVKRYCTVLKNILFFIISQINSISYIFKINVLVFEKITLRAIIMHTTPY